MKNLNGGVAAITGAGSGIGRALAVQLASSGCNLALSDIDEPGLDETARLAQRPGVTVTVHKLDVADREAVYDWAERVVADHGKVNIIVNNAGVGLSDAVESMTYEDFEWLMNINFWGVVHGTKAFLPHIKNAAEGNIVNISSVFGLVGIPTQAAYNSAKFAVKGFTESLIQELNIEDSPVHATCVHPGGIQTNIAGNARVKGSFAGPVPADASADERTAEFHKRAGTSSVQAADRIIRGIVKNQRRVLIGRDAWLIDMVQRLFPITYQRILERFARRAISAR